MRQLPFLGVVCTVALFFVYRITNYQHRQTEVQSPYQFFKSCLSSFKRTNMVNRMSFCHPSSGQNSNSTCLILFHLRNFHNDIPAMCWLIRRMLNGSEEQK